MIKHKYYCTVTCRHPHLSPIPPDPWLLSTITAVQKANKLIALKIEFICTTIQEYIADETRACSRSPV